MLSRVLVAVLVFMGCGLDLVFENLRQRELRYQIRTADCEVGLAELRLHAGRRILQRVVVETCFGCDRELKLLSRANASTLPPDPSGILLARVGERSPR